MSTLLVNLSLGLSHELDLLFIEIRSSRLLRRRPVQVDWVRVLAKVMKMRQDVLCAVMQLFNEFWAEEAILRVCQCIS